jgi:hypothetical protein
LLLAACGGRDAESTPTARQPVATTTSSSSTTTVPPTTTTEPPPTTTTLSPDERAAAYQAADVELIKELWRSYSDSWSTSEEAGFNFAVAHNYPPGECTVDDFRSSGYFADEGHYEEIVVDADTIERHDGWVMPAEPGQGEVPRGRVYVYSAQITNPLFVGTAEIHATIWKGEAYFFLTC